MIRRRGASIVVWDDTMSASAIVGHRLGRSVASRHAIGSTNGREFLGGCWLSGGRRRRLSRLLDGSRWRSLLILVAAAGCFVL